MLNKPNGTKYKVKFARPSRVLRRYGVYPAKYPKHIGEHVLIAEAVLGKKLPAGAIIHHVDGNKSNNCKNNLVICQDQEYHCLLHSRTNSLSGCGDVNKRLCSVCKEWVDQDSFYLRSCNERGTWKSACKNCVRKKAREYQKNKRIRDKHTNDLTLRTSCDL